MAFTRDFKKLSKNDVAEAGGKGASLGELTKAGIPVPPGFVILADAFEHFIHKTEITADIDSILHKVKHEDINSVEKASEEIKSIILSTEMPKEIEKEILQSYKQLNAKWVAVRSSATSEDSASAAWAGQLDSYLNTSEDKLLENVKKCWASLFTPRAIFYRFEKNLHNEKISVAVVVQKMVESEVSGIAFSVHPVTQDYNQLIIEAALGLGEAIVSGQITPDSYVVEKKGWLMLEKNIAEQNKALVKKTRGGNEWINLGEEGKKQKLSDEEILELSKLVVKIENHYGFPVDVEWAREKEKSYIVQSRPITTLMKDSRTENSLKNSTYFVRMFEATGMPFLINSIALEHYKPLMVIALFRENLWTTYLPKFIEKRTLKEGADLFGNKEQFSKYKEDSENYKKRSISYFKETLSKKELGKEDVNKYFALIAEHWKYYQKTEFFYVDDAYRNSKTDKVARENLKHLEEIKNSGREHLNNLIFGLKSYLSKILEILSKKFGVLVGDIFFYSKEEIIDLFDKKIVDKDILNERKDSYAFFVKDSDYIILHGEESKKYIKDFLVETSGNEIRGTIANRGKARGKVKVFFYGPDTFDKISEMIKDMDKGDILVTETTSPEIMAACKKASAILTNQGGLLSHAAIVSRELKIPCIVGTGNATKVLKDGDLVEVDADQGIVRILNQEFKKEDKKIKLEKYVTRVHSLFFWMMWNLDAIEHTKPWVGYDLKYILFVSEKPGRKVSVWHYRQELEHYYSNVKENYHKNSDFFNRTKKEYLHYWEKLFPYISKKRKIKTIAELKDYFYDLLCWWGPMANLFMIQELKDIPQKIRDEALKLREMTQEYSDMEDEVYLSFIKENYPEYAKIAMVLLPEEVSQLDKKPLSEKQLEEIKERLHGYFIWGRNIYPLRKLESFMQELGIVLVKPDIENLKHINELKGMPAYRGKVKGNVKIILEKNQFAKFKAGEILVTDMTSSEFVPLLKKASAIVTDEGGVMCHAAIVSRELKIPCIVGTKVATKILKDGDIVEVDANNGIIKMLKKA